MFNDITEFESYFNEIAKATLEAEGTEKATREAIERIRVLNIDPNELLDLLYFLPTNYIYDFMNIYKCEYNLDKKYEQEFDELLMRREHEEFIRSFNHGKVDARLLFSAKAEEKLLDKAEILDILQSLGVENVYAREPYVGDDQQVMKALQIFEALDRSRYHYNKQYKSWMETKDERLALLMSKIEVLEHKVSV